MESFVEAHVQELATKDSLSDQKRVVLERLLSPVSIGRPVVGFRVWAGHRLVFGDDRSLIGNWFAGTAAQRRAEEGYVIAELEGPESEDDAQIRALRLPILDIYAPLRQTGTGRIIAVLEIYEIAVELQRAIRIAQAGIWTSLALAALAIIWTLVRMAGRSEREALRLQAESERFRMRLSEASRHVSSVNERHMRRIGTDLHDGPVQLLGLALLKFEALSKPVGSSKAAAHTQARDLETIHNALNDTLREIRILAGSLLPSKIEDLSLAETLRMAVRGFEDQCGETVPCRIDGSPCSVPFSIKACLYRCVYESLDSSHRLLGASRQCVTASCQGSHLQLSMTWSGSAREGIPEEFEQTFAGVRARVEELGGTLSLESCERELAIVARFKLAVGELDRG
jgi:signal transduction histidine kinase